MKKAIILSVLSMLLLSGCSLFEPKRNRLAPELASDGMSYFNKGRYQSAIESFQTLRDWYPFDKLAILAELKIADAHYNLKEYEEAAAAYGQFENLHPHNEATPYVVYQIGRCYFDQIDTPDRDQGSAEKALQVFSRLAGQFPKSPYAKKAEENMEKCRQSMAAHELQVGMFYYKSKHYKAALGRFSTVVGTYPDAAATAEAERYIALCQQKLDTAE